MNRFILITALVATGSLTACFGPPDSISFTLTPDRLTVAQGQTGTTRVTVKSTGLTVEGGMPYPLNVQFSAPTGVTGTFVPRGGLTTYNGSSATLNVSVSGNVAPGEYTAVVSANQPVSSVAAPTVTLSLTVTSP